MKTLPLCDLETLLTIEAHAPHLLTPHDRHCLRLHRAAPAVKPVSYGGAVLCAGGLVILALAGMGVL